MKKEVYDYIATHPSSTANQCAEALHITGLEAMKQIHTLRKDGYVNVKIQVLGNENEADSSHFYSVRKVPYRE